MPTARSQRLARFSRCTAAGNLSCSGFKRKIAPPGKDSTLKQVRQNLASDAWSKLSPIAVFTKPDQLRYLRMRGWLSGQFAAIQLDLHGFRTAAPRCDV